MTTRPTDTPHWADAGSIVEPADAKQTAGWLFQERPPFEWMNWLANRFSIWVAHFASVASRFTGPDDAINANPASPLVVGDTCVIGDWTTGVPGFYLDDVDATNQTMHGVVATGDLVAFDRVGNVEFFARDGSGLVLTITPTIAMGPGCFWTNGDYTIMWDTLSAAPTNNVEIYRHLNGAQFPVAAGAGALPSRCILGPDDFFVAFEENGAGVDLERYNFSGVLGWSFNHSNGGASAGVSDIVQWGPFLYLVGSVSGHASGATMRCIEASTGADLTGEGGNGTSSALGARLWDAVTNAHLPTFTGRKYRQIKCDGRLLVVADRTANTVEVYAPGDGSTLRTLGVPAVVGSPLGVELDQDNVYASVEDAALGYVYTWTRREWAYVWRFPRSIGGAGGSVPVVSSDGFAVFLEDRSATVRTPIISKHLGPRLASRVDPLTETFREGNGLPFQRKIV